MQYIHQVWRLIPETEDHQIVHVLRVCPFVQAWTREVIDDAEVFTIYFYAPLQFIETFTSHCRSFGATVNPVVEETIK